ncbi:MAG: ribosomal-protein-alanine N-acetyltransferase [Desulfuromonadales bacterium C00003068]|nr:MAG: ribosomal-protein-alanine N-acetyltransferase [Desulfuromonadales bacterium C00003068]
MKWCLRSMITSDLPQVVAIEQSCHPHPWSADLFQRELDNPLAHLFVCVCHDEVIGYLCLWNIAGEVEIHNVATSPDWQRKGVAALLMQGFWAYVDEHHIDQAFLEVRCNNVAAIHLYEKHLFRVTDRRKGYYSDGEDALLMCWQRNTVND